MVSPNRTLTKEDVEALRTDVAVIGGGVGAGPGKEPLTDESPGLPDQTRGDRATTLWAILCFLQTNREGRSG